MHRIAVHSPMLALRERYDNPYSLKRRKKKKLSSHSKWRQGSSKISVLGTVWIRNYVLTVNRRCYQVTSWPELFPQLTGHKELYLYKSDHMSSFESSYTHEVYKVHSLFIPYPALWTTNTCQFLFKLWKSSYNNFHQNSASLLHMIIELQTHQVTLSQQTERSLWRCEKIWVLSRVSYSLLCRRCWYRSLCHRNEAEKQTG